MEQYTAINIGPIIATLGMARKPRELWAASYLFSHLMKCIYSEAEKHGAAIISPAKPETDKNRVGIYPDRIYIKGAVDATAIAREAIWSFYRDLFSQGKRGSNNPDLDYFNVMSATCEAAKESVAIGILNQKLNLMELCNLAPDRDVAKSIYDIIGKRVFSSLFELATGKDRLPIPELEEIARIRLSVHPEEKEKSHHRYFCVVQADGDNVGKTVSHQDLEDGQVLKISEKLVQFGLNATGLITSFGGIPVYAGGDDLLFLAPVIGKDGRHIFKLLDDIENNAFRGVRSEVDTLGLKDKDGNVIKASLSFGVSINYYKYPLYEALESARHLLFDVAKNTDRFPQKKAVAWSLRKHSGGTFNGAISLQDEVMKKQFQDLIDTMREDDIVSSVAHKIRQHQALTDVVLAHHNNRADRLDAFFEKVLEFDFRKDSFFNAVQSIMPTLYDKVGAKDYAQTLYGLLRTAKFIKGEDIRDE